MCVGGPVNADASLSTVYLNSIISASKANGPKLILDAAPSQGHKVGLQTLQIDTTANQSCAVSLYDYTRSASLLFFDLSGNCGINKVSPGAVLDVSGNIKCSGVVNGTAFQVGSQAAKQFDSGTVASSEIGRAHV